MLKQNDFRTYTRRPVTRRSGYKVSGDKSGGECIILSAEKYETSSEKVEFKFYREHLVLEELFESNFGMIAFGGYIYTQYPVELKFKLTYKDSSERIYEVKKTLSKSTKPENWNSFGFHKEFSLDLGEDIYDLKLTLEIKNLTSIENILQFISFDFDIVNFDYYKSSEAFTYFNQKTSMHIPHIYYLRTELPFNSYLIDEDKSLDIGDDVILKGCNRCSRYLPINIHDTLNTLAFSLHCKKKAPCKHSLFDRYTIDNINDLSSENLDKDYINDDYKVVTYYGHQLECKPCKKFFVNAALNPQRNSQQFREDSLRRRSTEILVNTLLGRDLIHHEFKNQSKKEFSEYIWKKFNKRCFKCGKKLALDEMHLDHTMPLAYLYRLDETATCLCAEHNSSKRDHFPVDFYTQDELVQLQQITGIDPTILNSRIANPTVVKLLIENVTWFFDVFLSNKDYQKVRGGILTADKIYASLVRVLDKEINLIDEYFKLNNKYPHTINID